MATKTDKARWARERNRRKKLGLPQPARGDGLRKYDHTGPTYRTRPSEYGVWSHIRTRCLNPNCKDWGLYGGRGIAICERWLKSFADFYNDMGPRPSPKHSIDRIDSEGDYSPSNCRWATNLEQANNRRNLHYITCEGVTRTLTEWSKAAGVSTSTMYQRIQRSGTSAAATPKISRRTRNPDGRYAKAIGI